MTRSKKGPDTFFCRNRVESGQDYHLPLPPTGTRLAELRLGRAGADGSMTTPKIAVIGGDGIGPELIPQAIRVADAALAKENARVEWNHLPWSSAYYVQHGKILPDDGWDTLAKHDAILF